MIDLIMSGYCLTGVEVAPATDTSHIRTVNVFINECYYWCDPQRLQFHDTYHRFSR